MLTPEITWSGFPKPDLARVARVWGEMTPYHAATKNKYSPDFTPNIKNG